MSKSSSSFTIGPMGIILIILLFNWLSDDEDKKKAEEIKEDVKETVEEVVDKVKAKIEDDTTYKTQPKEFEDDKWGGNIEWADE